MSIEIIRLEQAYARCEAVKHPRERFAANHCLMAAVSHLTTSADRDDRATHFNMELYCASVIVTLHTEEFWKRVSESINEWNDDVDKDTLRRIDDLLVWSALARSTKMLLPFKQQPASLSFVTGTTLLSPKRAMNSVSIRVTNERDAYSYCSARSNFRTRALMLRAVEDFLTIVAVSSPLLRWATSELHGDDERERRQADFLMPARDVLKARSRRGERVDLLTWTHVLEAGFRSPGFFVHLLDGREPTRWW